MTTPTSPRLDASQVALRLGMCATALAGTAATVQDAHAVVVNFTTPIAIPATTVGVYINLLTGATGGSSALTGWDFNPYLSNGGTQLGFYWSQTPTGTAGGVATTTTGPYLDLAPGTLVSSASTFTAAINQTTGTPFRTATGPHTLGFRFFNETTSAVNYGYLTMTTTAGTGFPAAITGWSFQNDGTGITTPVPEAPTSLMLSMGALALGAVQMRKLRRQRRQAVAH